jgi:hypothetical protein
MSLIDGNYISMSQSYIRSREDIEMPDMPLDDSFGQNYSSGSSKNNSKKADDDNVRPNLISFASPKAEFNLKPPFKGAKESSKFSIMSESS